MDSDMDLSVNMMEHVSKPTKRARFFKKAPKDGSNCDTCDSSDDATASTVGEASMAEEHAFMAAINSKNE